MTLPRLSASLMAADLSRLGDDIRAMDEAGIDAFHWDIMDGHFVPNLTFGPDAVKATRGLTEKFFDVHLMTEDPGRWIDPFARTGADALTFHCEVDTDIAGLLTAIKARGLKAGLAINPETGLEKVAPYTSQIDRLIIMTVTPGFGGQGYIDMNAKIQQAAAWRAEHPLLDIVVDGGINKDTAPKAVAAGATTLVSGSALFSQKGNYAHAIQQLRGGRA